MSVYPHIQALVASSNENFPVASRLLPKKARRKVLHFYAFARHADDIADHPGIPAEEKIAFLSEMQARLTDKDGKGAPWWVREYIKDRLDAGVDCGHGVDLLTAFLQDAVKTRYATFAELLEYCRYSAVPVGRTVLEACGEPKADEKAADALCTLLQLINHLQDCGKDYRLLNRVYLPQDWLAKHGAEDAMFAAEKSSPELQAVYAVYLRHCRALLADAALLPRSLCSLRLRLEIALMLQLAAGLIGRLERHDPLQKPVKIAHWQWFFHLFGSIRYLW